jgi:hypothetical protein
MRSDHHLGGPLAHIAVGTTLAGIFCFLAYAWIQKVPTTEAPRPTLTPTQEASGVMKQITSCLVDPTGPVGKPFKHIDGADLRDHGSAYFYASPTEIRFANASGEYLRRLLHCQISAK